MLCDDEYNLYDNYNVCNKYCTVECRAGNGTTNPIVWQNNINFFIKMLLYCKNSSFNNDICLALVKYVEFVFNISETLNSSFILLFLMYNQDIKKRGGTMPIKIADKLPATSQLTKENIFVMTEKRAIQILL